ncbi:MAG: TRAP transporter small permease subunit [Pseudomonadota bacterium]
MSRAIERIEIVLAGTFLVLMVAMIFTGGVARMMRMPLNMTIDLATCFFAWATFLSADIAWRRDRLIAVRLLPDRLPPHGAFWLVLINFAIILALLIYGIIAGGWLAWVSRARSFQGMPGVSYSLVTLALPVGATLMFYTTLQKIRDHWRLKPA